MLLKKYYILALLLCQFVTLILCQEPVFDIPVQLIGFPVIALSVRLANFAKKLMYSLNPGTYKSVSKRSYNLENEKHNNLNIFEVKYGILKEFGINSCIYEDICKFYTGQNNFESAIKSDLFLRIYQENIDEEEKAQLLSAFVGGIVKKPRLCSKLEKELPCKTKLTFNY